MAAPTPRGSPPRTRARIVVSGLVQGVGFRPFVFGVASRLGLAGWVRNQTGSVLIEVEGAPADLARFRDALVREAPRVARVDDVRVLEGAAARGETAFRIEPSAAAGDAPSLPPDVATCDDCAREALDPRDRRHGHAFNACNRCGPRFTVVTSAPYDRERTTMAAFAPCARCAAEYAAPGDRRFHAQAVACPACGPALALFDGAGARVATGDPVGRARDALARGAVVAIKGLGGYHLACDAARDDAVGALRARKHRGEKPLAVMVADVDAAATLCHVDEPERRALLAPSRPIVLLRKREGSPVSDAVAPGVAWLGVMLPYAPVHHLLLRGGGAGAPRPRALVMTSGNRADEPIAIDDADATARLAGVADAFLAHDRAIAARCDDSVVRVVDAAPLLLRRARGYAPLPVALPDPLAAPALAVGGHMKAAFALGEGRRAVLSPHVGDLDGYEALAAYVASVARLEALLGVAPRAIAHDLHPDYATTRYAVERSARDGTPRVAVQHHHAHLAACLADNGVAGPAIGVCFDGAGYGLDGAVWGGEFLVGDAGGFERFGHLAYVPLPGGERAAREGWRMAVAHLRAAGLAPEERFAPSRVPRAALRAAATLCERGFNAPPTSSVGRLFDAVASLAGVCDASSYEGMAAMRLESLATAERAGGGARYALDVRDGDGAPCVMDAAPLVRDVARDAARGVDPAAIARGFHDALAAAVVAVCERARAARGVRRVALSGGVFANAELARAARAGLAGAGFEVYTHRAVPPNDGGLCLGQLAVAARRAHAGGGA